MVNWQSCFGGSDFDYATDMVEFNNKYFILGNTFSNDGDISFLHGENDFWLVCTDYQGNMLWERTYGGSDSDGSHRIFSTGEGYFYLLGTSFSSDGNITNDPYLDSGDYWILKIDNLGNIIWDKIIGGNAGETLWTGLLTADNGVVVIGQTYSNDGDVSISYGMGDTWLVKINSEGELEWDFTIGTDFIDVGQTIIQTSDGGYLVGGSSMLGQGGNITCEPHSSLADAILTKLDADRNIEWQHCYGGSDHDGIYKIIELSDGYLFSAFTASDDGDVTGYHGNTDIWIVKIDFFGNIIWEHCFGGSNGEVAHNIFQMNNNEMTIFGQTRSDDGDVSGNHSQSEYDHDIWMFSINNEGELIQQQCFGGLGNEAVSGLRYGVVNQSENKFIIAAATDYGPSFDVGCTPHGGNGVDRDFWVFEVKDTTVNINENEVNDSGIKVYPNPAKDYVVFELPAGAPPSITPGGKRPTLLITNIFGKEKARIALWQEVTVWDCRGMEAGVYFYSFETEGVNLMGKIILQK
ncbi:MAG: hypothetical protein B6I19_06900 [Bacteroidetes bacterium 4572_114]|nr:MAG: hypothetical protein B6I19_06900 [Bacteroidetes bacterium 4572_114]